MSWGQNTSTGGDTWAPAADNNPSPAQISGVISPDRAVETQYGIKDVFDLQQADGNVWSVFMSADLKVGLIEQQVVPGDTVGIEFLGKVAAGGNFMKHSYRVVKLPAGQQPSQPAAQPQQAAQGWAAQPQQGQQPAAQGWAGQPPANEAPF